MPLTYERQLTFQPRDTGAGAESAAFKNISQRLDDFAAFRDTALDEEIAKSAKAKGMREGSAIEGVRLRDGTTIADEAYNEGLIASHTAALKLDADANITRLASEYPADPTALRENLKAYRNGLASGIDPRLQPIILADFDRQALTAQQKVEAEASSRQRDVQIATTGLASDKIKREALNAAANGNTEEAIDRIGAFIAFENTRINAGLISEADSIKTIAELTKEIDKHSVKYEFNQQLDKGNPVRFINNLRKAEIDWLDPKEKADLIGELMSGLNENNRMIELESKAEEAERKAEYRKTEQEATSLYLSGQLTLGWVQEKVKDGAIDPTLARQLEERATKDGPAYNNEAQVLEYSLDLASFTESEIAMNESLTIDKRIELIDKRRDQMSDATNWRGTQNGQEAVRRIKGAFDISDGISVLMQPEQVKKASIVLTRLYNEIELIPVIERPLRAVEIADRLISEIGKEDSLAELEKKEKRIAELQYPTIEAIDAAEQAGELREAKAEELRKQLTRELGKIEELRKKAAK